MLPNSTSLFQLPCIDSEGPFTNSGNICIEAISHYNFISSLPTMLIENNHGSLPELSQ